MLATLLLWNPYGILNEAFIIVLNGNVGDEMSTFSCISPLSLRTIRSTDEKQSI